ncbi:sugar ABC transporter permease [Kaistia dalseonensis]|uniref:Multiple sugar transport system permease protein n=1 Tax=Kaistia dalseonensis TaxID=410840 RepID=A0ABU0HCD2_9HYPH|nr:sugar ABC transporter permease [Kaistia dalseonensis]MCX5496794.1 sugar ABC transporter permease [Kaistia dalseonensis]MDQ0439420.1 multiple sugar transport system permease protein [Kaistia dalseonensis]
MTSTMIAKETESRQPTAGRRSIFGNNAHRLAYLFVLPALVLVILFRIVPLIWGLGYSFTDYNGMSTPTFVGVQNYVAIAHDPVFLDSLINMLILLATLPIWIGLPLVLAILIHQGVPGGKLFRAVYFFPAVLSSVIVGAIFNMLLRYDGSFNAALKAMGFSAIDWLGNSNTALFSLIAVQLWATFGMSLLIFLAGLSTVPSDMLEAAKLDGAKLMQTWWYIVIPSIRPIIEFAAVVTTIGMLTSMFGLIYVLTAGGPGTATTLPEFLIWLEQGKMNRPGYASAISMVLFLMMGGLAWIQIRIMSKNADL